MFGHDPETALETDEFLQMCVRADTDKEFSVELQMVRLMSVIESLELMII